MKQAINEKESSFQKIQCSLKEYYESEINRCLEINLNMKQSHESEIQELRSNYDSEQAIITNDLRNLLESKEKECKKQNKMILELQFQLTKYQDLLNKLTRFSHDTKAVSDEITIRNEAVDNDDNVSLLLVKQRIEFESEKMKIYHDHEVEKQQLRKIIELDCKTLDENKKDVKSLTTVQQDTFHYYNIDIIHKLTNSLMITIYNLENTINQMYSSETIYKIADTQSRNENDFSNNHSIIEVTTNGESATETCGDIDSLVSICDNTVFKANEENFDLAQTLSKVVNSIEMITKKVVAYESVRKVEAQIKSDIITEIDEYCSELETNMTTRIAMGQSNATIVYISPSNRVIEDFENQSSQSSHNCSVNNSAVTTSADGGNCFEERRILPQIESDKLTCNVIYPNENDEIFLKENSSSVSSSVMEQSSVLSVNQLSQKLKVEVVDDTDLKISTKKSQIPVRTAKKSILLSHVACEAVDDDVVYQHSTSSFVRGIVINSTQIEEIKSSDTNPLADAEIANKSHLINQLTSQTSPVDHLIGAILEGDIQGIRTIIRNRGESLNSSYWQSVLKSLLPLHRAVASLHFHGDSELVISTIDELIHAGADINCRDVLGNTVLQKAIQTCSSKNVSKIVKHLLTHNANPNLRNHAQETALHVECKRLCQLP
jgi:hypothetical protein